MRHKFPTPVPLIDTLDNLFELRAEDLHQPIYAEQDLNHSIDFLQQYDGSKATFSAYRKEVERLLQWSWLIAEKSILDLGRADIEEYIQFCLKPPKSWIALKRVPRFASKDGLRVPNKAWRPFVADVSKADHYAGITADKAKYQLSQKSIQEIFTILSSFYKYLQLSDLVPNNPVALIRQKSKYLRKQQGTKPIPKLTDLQWEYVIEATENMAGEDPARHERSLFIMTALYLMYLRISELVASERWQPQMGHFYKDAQDNWWFKTVGKGNKARDVSVSDDMLKALARYRASRGLTPRLPLQGEETPLLHNLRDNGTLSSTRNARAIVQQCFNRAYQDLKHDGFNDEAASLMQATVHWLRHTGISNDINTRGRPIAHVRDDAGHSSSATTDRYNNVDLAARNRSARNKKVKDDF